MKRFFSVKVFVFLLAFGLFASVVSAGGIGIHSTSSGLLINEGESECVTFGIYNPDVADNELEFMVSEELEPFLDSISPESMNVPANTESENSLPVELCFSDPDDLFKGDRSCSEGVREYAGKFIVRESSDGSGGSSVVFDVPRDFTLRAQCVPDSVSYSLLIIIIVIIIVIIVILVFVLRGKKNTVPMPLSKNTQMSVKK